MVEENWVPLSSIKYKKDLGITETENFEKYSSFSIMVSEYIDMNEAVESFMHGTTYEMERNYVRGFLDIYFDELNEKIHTANDKCKVSDLYRGTSFSDYSLSLLSGAIKYTKPKSLFEMTMYDEQIVTGDLPKIFRQKYKHSNLSFYKWLVNYIDVNLPNGITASKNKEETPMSNKTKALTTAAKGNVEFTKVAAKVAIDIEAGKLGVRFIKEQVKPFLPEHLALMADTTEGEFVLAQAAAFMLQATSGMHKHPELAESISQKMITFAAVQELDKFNIGDMLVGMAKSMGLDAGKMIGGKETPTE